MWDQSVCYEPRGGSTVHYGRTLSQNTMDSVCNKTVECLSDLSNFNGNIQVITLDHFSDSADSHVSESEDNSKFSKKHCEVVQPKVQPAKSWKWWKAFRARRSLNRLQMLRETGVIWSVKIANLFHLFSKPWENMTPNQPVRGSLQKSCTSLYHMYLNFRMLYKKSIPSLQPEKLRPDCQSLHLFGVCFAAHSPKEVNKMNGWVEGGTEAKRTNEM